MVLGEIGDADTIDTAIKGAETGRLVIASMPTPNVVDHHRADPHDPAARGARDRPDAALGGAPRDRVPAAPAREGREGPRARHRAADRDARGAGVPQGREPHRASSASSWPTAASSSARRRSSSTSRELAEAGTITAETAKAALLHERRARASGQEGRKAGRLRLSRPAVPSLDQTMRTSPRARRARPVRPAAAEARDLVAAHLEALGYQVQRQRFAFAPSQPQRLSRLRRGPRRAGAAAAPAAHRQRRARLGRGPGARRGLSLLARRWPSGSGSAGSRWAAARARTRI